MEVYAQQVALQQLKDENQDRARLAQKLAELEVRQQKCKSSWNVSMCMLSQLEYQVHVVGGLFMSKGQCSTGCALLTAHVGTVSV